MYSFIPYMYQSASSSRPQSLLSRMQHLGIVRMLRYSRFLIRSIFNTFVRPPLLIFLLSKIGILRFPQSSLLSVGVYVLSIPASEVILSTLSSRRKRRDYARLGAIPIPKVKGRRFGNIDVLQALIEAEDKEYPGDIFLKWSLEYGPTFDMNILWASQIVTVDPENVKFALSNAFTSFEKSEKFHDMFETFWGDGIFTTDGDSWKRHRANARPFFSQERLSDFTIFDKHMEKLLEIIDHARLDSQAFDIQDLFARYTLDTATEFLFGSSAKCLDGFAKADDDAQYAQFMKAFNQAASLGATRIRIGSTWPLFELTGDKAVEPTKIIDSFVLPIIKKAFQTADGSANSNLMEYLAHVTQDEKAVRDECLNILFAARDSTASLLTFTAYFLMEHPDVAERMRAEVLDVCGGRRTISITDIKRMKYIEAVLNEVLRLLPPIPYNIRRSIESSALPSPQSRLGMPLYMPPRSSFTYVPILIHRDPLYWGNDASQFRPKRWLSDNPPMSHPNAFVPFNMGPRICLGQQLAYIQATYVFARLLQNLSFERAPDSQPTNSIPPNHEWVRQNGEESRHGVETVWPHASIVLRVKGGLWARAVDPMTHE